MKKPVTFILIALVIQYICDFNFLYEAYRGYWYAGGPGDFLYALSYFVMTWALIYIGFAFKQVRES